MKIKDKKIIFSVKNKQKGKYAKKKFLVSKRLIQFLNKPTYNSFLLECSKKHKTNIKLITLVLETVNPIICRFQ